MTSQKPRSAQAGLCFTWGEGGHGQLGYACVSAQTVPRQVRLPRGALCCGVACGRQHTALLESTGRLYTWGAGKHGQLGHGDRPSAREKPQQVARAWVAAYNTSRMAIGDVVMVEGVQGVIKGIVQSSDTVFEAARAAAIFASCSLRRALLTPWFLDVFMGHSIALR